MKQTVPTISEAYAALKVAFEILLLKEKLRGNGQAYIADAIDVQPNYISNVLNGRKNLGDNVVARLDEKFPDWRDLEVEDLPNREAKPLKIDEPNELKRQLNHFYDGMTEAHKEAIVDMANILYSLDNPDDVVDNPYSGRDKRKGKPS